MAEEVRVDPVELTRLGDQMLGSSQQVSDAWRLDPPTSSMREYLFGDEDVADGVATAYEGTVVDADLVVGRLVEVLEGDMDRLYRIAFAYQQADDDEAEKIRRQHPNFPI